MEEQGERVSRLPSIFRVALALFVLAWLFGPYTLRSTVPVWLPFLIALGLELHFAVGAFRPGRGRRPDPGPQAVDRERYGYEGEGDDLLLVREGGEELWIPHSGETEAELEAALAAARERAEHEADAAVVAVERRPRLWSRRPRFLAGLGVIAALALILWVAERRTGWDALEAATRAEATARFSAEASRVAGKPVTIRCDESGDYVGPVQHADGVATVGGELAYLTPDRCQDLYRLAFKDEVRPSQTARALAVLAHEAWHLRGVRDEGTTECYALQSGVEIGRRLGLSESTARQLMRQQLTENALRAGASREYRVSPDCRNGSPLDLNRGSARFP